MSRLFKAGRLGQVYIGWGTGHNVVTNVGEWIISVGPLLIIASPPESDAAWGIV